MVKWSRIFMAIICFSCTKEVQVIIPGFEEMIVVEGRIETNGFPIVLLSKNANIYESTNLSSYINSFIEDAVVVMGDGTDSVFLNSTTLSDLPQESVNRVAEIFDIEPFEVVLLPIKVYTTNDTAFQGKLNHSYHLRILYEDKVIVGTTQITPQVKLDSLFWVPSQENQDYGTSWALLSDPGGGFNAYRWEVKRINLKNDQPKDLVFKSPRNGFFSDRLINGQTIHFDYPNPMKRKDSTHLREFKSFYRENDSVVVKFSTMDEQIFEYYRSKRAQLASSNDPFATPINVKSNLVGPGLGVWAGFSPSFDTLICVP